MTVSMSKPISDERSRLKTAIGSVVGGRNLVFVCVLILGFARVSHAGAEGRFDRTCAISSPLRIDVLTDSGDISVRVGEPGKIEIHARIYGAESAQDESVESRILSIAANPPIQCGEKGRSVSVGRFANADVTRGLSISYEILAPADAQIHSETGSGNQTIEGFQGPVESISGSGNLHLWHIARETQASTGSGNIDFRDVHGEVRAKAGTGTIQAAEIADETQPQKAAFVFLESPNASAKAAKPETVLITLRAHMEITTGSGDVDVADLDGGLEVTSGSGNIRVSGKPSSVWKLETGTGIVRVQFASETDVTISAHTSSGTVTTHLPIDTHGASNPHELHGNLGRGGGDVHIETASGDIEID